MARGNCYIILSCNHAAKVSEDMFRLYRKGQSFYCTKCGKMVMIVNKVAEP